MCHGNDQPREVLSWDSYLWALLKQESSVICKENGGRKSAKVGQPRENRRKVLALQVMFSLQGTLSRPYKAPSGSCSIEGVEDGCAILERDRKALRDNFLWDTFGAQAESQHPLALQPQLLVPIPITRKFWALGWVLSNCTQCCS